MKIPFHKNHGHRCAQAVIKSVLEARLPKKQLPFKELDKLTLHQEPEITLPTQIAYGLHQLGIPFEYYTKPNGLSLASSPASLDYFRQHYGDELMSSINMASLYRYIEGLQKSIGIIEVQSKPSIEKLEEITKEGKIAICLVNWDIFNGKPNTFSGHYIIPTGFEKNDIIYHDSGPHEAAPNKRVSRDIFQKAWDLSLIDHDLIVV